VPHAGPTAPAPGDAVDEPYGAQPG
jgi:hypothetical protein